jgi:hypothetical protein
LERKKLEIQPLDPKQLDPKRLDPKQFGPPAWQLRRPWGERSAALASILGLALSVGPGCRCGQVAPSSPPDAAAELPFEAPTAAHPPPSSWAIERVARRLPISVPPGCRASGPLARAAVSPRARFVAVPGALGALVVGELGLARPDAGDDEPEPELSRAGLVRFGAGLEPRPPLALPWLRAESLPRFAHLEVPAPEGEWLAAVDRAVDERRGEVALWRERGPAVRLAVGAGFEALDLRCSERGGVASCLVLTTRLGEVERPGADVFRGPPSGPFTRVELPTSSVDGGAKPHRLVDVPPGASPVVTQEERGELVWHELPERGAPRELARVPVAGGVLAAAWVGGPLAVLHADPLTPAGCAAVPVGSPTRITLVRPGKPSQALSVSAPPERVLVLAVPGGARLFSFGRTGCEAERRVLSAYELDAEGALVGHGVPVGDATHFAATHRGAEVELWLQQEGDVLLSRLSCP